MDNQLPITVEKVWGKEIWFANNGLYCGKLMTLKEGYQCSYHFHKIKDETFCILNGLMLLEIEGMKILLNPGEAQRILPNQRHTFIGLEKTVFIEVSTHHDDNDSYRIPGMESRKIPDEEFKRLKEEYTQYATARTI